MSVDAAHTHLQWPKDHGVHAGTHEHVERSRCPEQPEADAGRAQATEGGESCRSSFHGTSHGTRFHMSCSSPGSWTRQVSPDSSNAGAGKPLVPTLQVDRTKAGGWSHLPLSSEELHRRQTSHGCNPVSNLGCCRTSPFSIRHLSCTEHNIKLHFPKRNNLFPLHL
jgi:hypothetical protein